MTEKIMTKLAEVVADMLIHHAEMEPRASAVLFVSEPEIPVELLKEDMR